MVDLGLKIAVLKLLLRALRDPETKEVVASLKDVSTYIPRRAAHVIQSSGVDFAGKPLSEFRDPVFARLVADVLASAKLGRVSGDVFEWSDRGRHVEVPRPRTRLFADIKPVIDVVLGTLPHALETGEKPLLYTKRASEARMAFARFLDNKGYYLFRRLLAVEVAGLDRLPPDAVIVDVGSGIGASVKVLLDVTKARIVATDPHDENLEVLRRLVSLRGDEGRVKVVKARGEELSSAVGRGVADAVFMVNVLHWSVFPEKVLSEIYEVLKPGGALAMMQAVYDTASSRAMNIVTYLMGSDVLPAKRDLDRMIRAAGFTVKRSARIPMYMLLLEKPP